MPRFSVIIPLYNKEKDIAHTLTSVLNQTFTDFEIIVIDDGSTDTSAKIIEDFKSDKVVLYSKKNEGVSIARNFGVEKSNSKFIAFLDADDYWYPNHLENINTLIENFPESKWFATAYEKKHSKNLISSMYTPILEKGEDWYGEVSDFFKYSYIDCLAWTSSICMNKYFYKSLNGFDSNITHGEDTDLWIRAALKEKLVFSNKITAQHNLISSNRSTDIPINNRCSFEFDSFILEEKKNSSLKKYLDLNRYSLIIKNKLSGTQLQKTNDYYDSIDLKNLNKKQRFLIKQNKITLQLFFFIQRVLEYLGIRLSSF